MGFGRATLAGGHCLSPVWPPSPGGQTDEEGLGTGIKNLKAPRILQVPDHAGKLLQLEESHLHQKGVKPATEINIRGQGGRWDVMRIGINMRLRQKS